MPRDHEQLLRELIAWLMENKKRSPVVDLCGQA